MSSTKLVEKERTNAYLAKLAALGFSKAQGLVYVYLLERGSETGVSKIAIGTNMHRQQVYLTIPLLLEAGIIEEVGGGKIAKYKARPPQHLERIARRKMIVAEDLAQELQKISKIGNEQDFEVVVGEAAYRAYEIHRAKEMKDGDVQYLIGSSSDEYLDVMGESYEHDYVPLLEAKNIKTFYIAPEAQKDRANKISSRQHFEIRMLPKLKPGYITTMIQGDNLVFYSNVKPASIYVIKSAKVAESYKDFFMMLWEMAK